MRDSQKLTAIKLLHTVIWAIFVSFIFYILYSGISGNITTFTWAAIIAIIAEGIILMIFKLYCPLTLIARKYSDSEKDNFDIYLPNWLAKHNKTIFTAIYLIGVVIVLARMFAG